MKIYIVRHGQSTGNINGGFCGFSDVLLSPLGEKQAKMTAEYLASVKIDRIFSSPLSRAFSTALPIAKSHGLKITLHDGLKEMNFGDWEGVRGYMVEEKYNGAFTVWKNEPWKTECPNGESLIGFYDRAASTLSELAKANAGSDICIVSHGAWTKCIICYAKGLGVKSFGIIDYPANASVTTLEYNDGTFSLVEENHYEHLGDDVTTVKA